ncbi:MAG: efflux RND transporter periplasmic adaptor subunit [Pseudomonadota bacterium]
MLTILHRSLRAAFLFALPWAVHAAPLVTVKPLEALAVYPNVSVSGEVISLNDSELSAEIRAVIREIPVLVGQRVRKNDVLARLECHDYQNQALQAAAAQRASAARVALADFQLERARSLRATDTVSAELVKQRETEAAAAHAEQDAQTAAVALAQKNVVRCEVRAPFAGIVTARLGQVGELAQPGSPLVRLVEGDAIEVSAKLRGEEVAALQGGKGTEFITQGARYPLRLRVVSPAFDARERTREARLLFTGEKALPGSVGEVVWRAQQAHLPSELISKRGGRLGALVLEGEQAKFVPLPQAQEGRPVRVDLPPTTRIIVEGRYSLQDGDKVQVQ